MTRKRKSKSKDDSCIKPISKDSKLDFSSVSLSHLKVPLKSASEAHPLVQRDFIESGYLDCENHNNTITHNNKQTKKTLNLCESSMHTLLSCHNETGNIYTHLIPSIIVLISLISEMFEIIFDSNIHRFVTFTVLIGVFLCFICSAIFHAAVCIVPSKHDTYFIVDLFGIFSSIVASANGGIFIVYECHYFWKILYLITFNAMLAFILVPVVLIWPQHFSVNTKIYVSTACAAFNIVPAIHYCLWLSTNDELMEIGIRPLIMGLIYSVGFVIFRFRFPERYFPKTFDYIGSSHQIWHLFVTIGSLYWWNALNEIANWRLDNPCNHYTQ